MYSISNRQMELVVRYVGKFRAGCQTKGMDTRSYNDYRMAGILLRQLVKKQGQRRK